MSACTMLRHLPLPQVLADSRHVLMLRDRDSVAELARRLPAARRAVLVGNGGIALELAHALRGLEVSPCPPCRPAPPQAHLCMACIQPFLRIQHHAHPAAEACQRGMTAQHMLARMCGAQGGQTHCGVARGQVVWVTRHSAVGDAFFDVDAAQFLLQELQAPPSPSAEEPACSTAEVQEAPAC